MLNLIAWAVLGLIAGAIGKAIYPGTQGGGIFATMALGVAGAFIGGFLVSLLTGTQILAGPLSIPSIIVAIIGAIIAIFLWGLITRRAA
jgi:uncharacterized membrane protein YeaQ/YmgE (transglycosylase-associated protein family)